MKIRKKSQKIALFSLLCLLIFSFWYLLLDMNSNNHSINHISYETYNSIKLLGTHPIIKNITSVSQYYKNGDCIKLIVDCDQANYSIFANFSTIDNKFTPSAENVTDFKNGTYHVNYFINLSNTQPDGLYQIIINVTNTTSGFSQLYNETYLSLDNTLPSIFVISPHNGTYLNTDNLTIKIFMNATGSLIKQVTLNDSRFEFLTNYSNKQAGEFLIVNKSAITEGPIGLNITLIDSVDLNNNTFLNIILDNTIPNITGELLTQKESQFFISLNVKGTFSPITDFRYNISEFEIIVGSNPIGKLEEALILVNPANSLPDGYYTLNVTIVDSVNLTNSILVDFMLDLTPPFFETILQNDTQPEYYECVNITIINPQDIVSGINNIILNYTTDDWHSWHIIDLTERNYGILPEQAYGTFVQYKIELTDNEGNTNTSLIFSYFVDDTIPPVLQNIKRDPISPTRYTTVNISIGNIFDLGAGIESILLNYSIDGGLSWIIKNITETRWGIIEKQPLNTKVLYQIFANDSAGNEVRSELSSYTVRFDYTRFFLLLFIIGAIVGVSSYIGKILYSKQKRKHLKLEYLQEKEKLADYIELRLADFNIILKDIELIEQNLDKLLMYEWIPLKSDYKTKDYYKFQIVKEFIGITQLISEIYTHKVDMIQKLQEFNKKYYFLKLNLPLAHKINQFNEEINDVVIALGHLRKKLRIKYSKFLSKKPKLIKIPFPLSEFDSKFAKVINKFGQLYETFTQEFDQLLISRKIKDVETRINLFDSLFEETDKWLSAAEKWSKKLPLPKDRGYKYLLKMKKDQYSSIKNECQIKIEKLRAELTSSIRFAQNFIQWNYNSLLKRLEKFESTIFEEIFRLITTNDSDVLNIDLFVKEKFENFRNQLIIEKEKVEDFYESHKEFHIQAIYDKWILLMEKTIPSRLRKIKDEINAFITPLNRINRLIKGISSYFYKDSMKSIAKFQNNQATFPKIDEKLSPLNILFSKTIWQINRIDEKIKRWINLLPFDLKTPELMILLSNWNNIKEEILQKLNNLSKEQKIYKCEIMHEILDPLNDEIWECSNCGAIACTDHLEKWYHHKKAPECFKCGNTNTFRLKTFKE